jgi:hypothetical protein
MKIISLPTIIQYPTVSSAELRSTMALADPDIEACAKNILQKDYPNNQESTSD